jgi:hypothetical protein
MLAFAVEFTLVVAFFVWAWRREVHARRQANRPPPDQLRLPFEDDRKVGS